MRNAADICDACVTAVKGQLADGEDVTVERQYLVPLQLEDLSSLNGRRVYVFPAGYAAEAATRSEDLNSYSIAVLVLARHTGVAEDLKAWLDAEQAWIRANVWDVLTDPRNAFPAPLNNLWAQTADVVNYDVEVLDQYHALWCEINIEYREVE